MSGSWSNIWQILFWLTIVAAFATLVPIVLAFLKQVKLQKTAKWFDDTNEYPEQKERLIAHALRLEGTLLYWKNKASAHHRVHIARVLWSLFSAVTLPVIIQFYDKSEPWSIAFLTVFTIFTGFIVALAHALKSEEMSRGFRECESDYYDTARALLDHPKKTSEEREKQVTDFFIVVERIRKAGRKVETNRPPSGIRV